MEGDAVVRREVLPNGLRLLVREARAAPVVAMNLWVGSGSARDPEELQGLSHFIEHLLFKGVGDEAVVDVAREVQEAGGYLNAETGCDYTVYHQIVSSDRWVDVLTAQAAGVCGPAFDQNDVEAERAVIVEEATSAENDPSVFVWRRLMKLAFDRHPYRRPIVGTVDSLSLITSSDLRNQCVVGGRVHRGAYEVAAEEGADPDRIDDAPRGTRRPVGEQRDPHHGHEAVEHEGAASSPSRS